MNSLEQYEDLPETPKWVVEILPDPKAPFFTSAELPPNAMGGRTRLYLKDIPSWHMVDEPSGSGLRTDRPGGFVLTKNRKDALEFDTEKDAEEMRTLFVKGQSEMWHPDLDTYRGNDIMETGWIAVDISFAERFEDYDPVMGDREDMSDDEDREQFLKIAKAASMSAVQATQGYVCSYSVSVKPDAGEMAWNLYGYYYDNEGKPYIGLARCSEESLLSVGSMDGDILAKLPPVLPCEVVDKCNDPNLRGRTGDTREDPNLGDREPFNEYVMLVDGCLTIGSRVDIASEVESSCLGVIKDFELVEDKQGNQRYSLWVEGRDISKSAAGDYGSWSEVDDLIRVEISPEVMRGVLRGGWQEAGVDGKAVTLGEHEHPIGGDVWRECAAWRKERCRELVDDLLPSKKPAVDNVVGF